MQTLPDKWRRVAVSDLVSISHGYAFKGECFSFSGTDALATPGNFMERGGFRHSGAKQRYYTADFPASYRLRANDLIVAMTEQTDGLLGSAAHVPPSGAWLHNQRVGRVRTRSSDVTVDYLYFVFNNSEFRKSVSETAAGTKVRHTSPTKLGAVEILLPAPPEQQRIVEKLRDVDALIDAIDRLIVKKQAMKLGVMQQLLTGRTRLPGFDHEWYETTIADLAAVDPDALPSGTHPGTRIDYISLEDVSHGELLGSSEHAFGSAPTRARRILQAYDVLFGTVRPNLKSHLLYSGGLRNPIASTGFTVVRAGEQANPAFLFNLLISDLAMVQINRIIAGSNYPAVSSRDVRNLVFAVPHVSEQRAIAEMLSGADDEIAVLQRRLVKTKAIKTGVAHQLLTGRTRLTFEGAAS